MSYQALYRVWRPQRFDEIVGQTVITQTLKNAIVTQQTSHAYLFCGPRGTGKTSAAKIFAKAINCPNQKDGEPCNECEICKSITSGQLNDVIEIDAASNNGVEEIRDIRDKAKYAPTQATYKIYIIDEVHMLSTGAFNALLKTLEEPPANVIFILATTEPHKIPATIISRTQRFDFKRITAQESFDRMVYILKQKQVDFEEPALKVIANAAEGGMRDALSILDQTISFGDNEVTLDNALLVTGSVTESLLADYVKQVVAHETTAGLAALQKVLDDGKDAGRFVEDVISYVRYLLLYKEAPDMVTGSDTTGDVFQQPSKNNAPDVFYQMINALNEVAAQLRFTTHPDVYLEVLTVKLAQIYPTQGNIGAVGSSATAVNNAEVEELQTQIQQLKQTVSQLKTSGVQTSPIAGEQSARRQAPTISTSEHSTTNSASTQTTSTVAAPTNQPASTTGTPAGAPARAKKAMASASHASANVNLAKIYPVLKAATKHDLDTMRDVWDDLLDTLPVTQKAMMHVSKPVAASNEGVIVSFSYAFFFDKAATDDGLRKALEDNLNRLTGDLTDVWFVPEDQWPQIRKDFLTDHKEELTGGNTPSTDGTPAAAPTAVVPPTSEHDDTGVSEPENELVTKAQQLFGADNVTIKDD